MIKKIAVKVAVAAFWLLIWQICYLLVDRPLYLDSPLHALQALLRLLPNGSFWASVSLSLFRILLGLACGCAVGMLLSVFTNRSKIVSSLFRPILTLAKTVPVVSFIMLLWLAFFHHKGAMPILISALMVFPIMWSDMMSGFRSMDEKILEMAKVYATPLDTLLYVKIPHLFPHFLSGISTSIGLAWKAGVAAEVICRPDRSIGRAIYIARDNLESDVLFAWTAVVVLLSLLLESIVVRLLRKVHFHPRMRSSETMADHGETHALLFDHISKHYGEKTVLDRFTYTFRNGRVIALMGPSGCGKTTLLMIAAGLLEDDERRYRLPPKTSPGVIFQENRLIPTLTVRENILFANRAANVKRILESLSLSEDADRYPNELSGGMQRRVAIGRAIAFQGGIGIFDEPFSGLDEDTKMLCARALFQAYREKTVAFVTHDEKEAQLFANEILRLQSNSQEKES